MNAQSINNASAVKIRLFDVFYTPIFSLSIIFSKLSLQHVELL